METKFSSHKRYLFGLVFSRNAKKTHTDQSILPTFLLSLKRSVSKTLEKSSCKKVFPKCVFYGSNLLRWVFFIPCHNWKTFFFYTILWLPRGLVQPPCCWVLWNKYFERSLYYISNYISIISTTTLNAANTTNAQSKASSS